MIVKFVNVIIAKAIRDGASDIHVEPAENLLRVRFRMAQRLEKSTKVEDREKAQTLRRAIELSGGAGVDNQFAKLVGILNSVTEGGGALLDNTATMWLQELSDGAAHNLNNLPIIIAGSAGGYLKQGQVVNVDPIAVIFNNAMPY